MELAAPEPLVVEATRTPAERLRPVAAALASAGLHAAFALAVVLVLQAPRSIGGHLAEITVDLVMVPVAKPKPPAAAPAPKVAAAVPKPAVQPKPPPPAPKPAPPPKPVAAAPKPPPAAPPPAPVKPPPAPPPKPALAPRLIEAAPKPPPLAPPAPVVTPKPVPPAPAPPPVPKAVVAAPPKSLAVAPPMPAPAPKAIEGLPLKLQAPAPPPPPPAIPPSFGAPPPTPAPKIAAAVPSPAAASPPAPPKPVLPPKRVMPPTAKLPPPRLIEAPPPEPAVRASVPQAVVPSEAPKPAVLPKPAASEPKTLPPPPQLIEAPPPEPEPRMAARTEPKPPPKPEIVASIPRQAAVPTEIVKPTLPSKPGPAPARPPAPPQLIEAPPIEPAPPVVAPRAAAPVAAATVAPPKPAPVLRSTETAPPPAKPAPASRLAALTRPAPLPPAPAIDPRPGVRQALAGLDCARVEATVADGVVSLSGHIRDDTERRRLEQTLSAVPGVRRVDAAGLRLLGDPYCGILDFLARPGLVRSTDQRADLAELGTRAEAGVAHFSGGTPLKLNLAAPEFDSYLYVDYFAADGTVAHLLPGRNAADNHFGANEKFILGPGGRGLVATIGAPFGLDVVVALASSAPLPLAGRPVAEDAGAYLASLDAALAALRRDRPDVRVEYAYFLIYTAAPGAPAAAVGGGSDTSARAR